MDKLEYLRNIIRKTGYPLEIQISSLLDKRWDVVLNTDSYYDREEEKLRDIDIVTSRTHFYQGTNVTLQTGLVIECKKTEKYAWVFFTRPFSFDHTEVTGQYLDKIQCVTNNLEKSNFLDEILFQPELMHYADFKRVSVAYSEFILKSESVDRTNKHEIFEAQNQVKKYLDCQYDQFIKASSRSDSTPVYFYFPCIVLDGDMFEAIVDEDNLELKEVNHLLLSTTYKSPFAIFERQILVDVVKKEFFNTYLENILKDCAHLEKCLGIVDDQLEYRVKDILEYFPQK